MATNISMERSACQLSIKCMMHTFADLVGCSHCGYALDKWSQNQHVVDLGYVKEGNNKWRAYIDNGSLPREPLFSKLLSTFPELAEVLDNSLWLALSAQPVSVLPPK